MEENKEQVEEKKTKKRKKKSWILVTILVILLLIAAAVGGYLAGASKIADLVIKQNNEVKEEITKEETVEKDVPKCTGKYYGEKTGTENGVSFDYKYTYELREDGTYSVNYSDVQGADGKYVEIGNSICFVEPLEVVGPGDYPHYNSYCSFIKDDCSSILKNISDNGERMELKKTE